MSELPPHVFLSVENADVHTRLCRACGVSDPPWTLFEPDTVQYDRAEFSRSIAALAALDPGKVQLVLDTSGHGRDGLEWQLYKGLPSGPHPSVLRVHDRGVSAWHELYEEDDYLLVWAWAPDEARARSAVDAAIPDFWPVPQRGAQSHSGNVLPPALHPRRVPYLDRRQHGRWIAALERAQYAGLYDDEIVSLWLT